VSESVGLAIPEELGPGMVPIGFAEDILERARAIDDPALLWDGATTFAGVAQKWNGLSRENAELKAAQMFCEILVGQMLGPSPGEGGDRKSAAFRSSAHAHLIPKEISIQDNGQKGTCFAGPQVIERRGLHAKTMTVATEAEFFRWLAAPLEGPITYRVNDGRPGRPAWWPLRNALS
jgi:hypothetical protein